MSAWQHDKEYVLTEWLAVQACSVDETSQHIGHPRLQAMNAGIV